MMKLSDLVDKIKKTPHIVEFETAKQFTREFEKLNKTKMIEAIQTLTLDKIIEAHLNESRGKNYVFKQKIYSCLSYGSPLFTKQFLYDIHKIIESHLKLTEFKVFYEVFANLNDIEYNIFFYIMPLGDPKPDYFEYFDFEKINAKSV